MHTKRMNSNLSSKLMRTVFSMALSVSSVAMATPVTYDLVPFTDGSYTVQGTLTIDDAGVIGEISAPEITQWEIFVSPAWRVSGGVLSCNDVCFRTSGDSLLFDFDQSEGVDPRFSVVRNDDHGGLIVETSLVFSGGTQTDHPFRETRWFECDYVAGDPYVCLLPYFIRTTVVNDFGPPRSEIVAIVQGSSLPDPEPSPVPEPTSLMLLGISLVSTWGCRRTTRALA